MSDDILQEALRLTWLGFRVIPIKVGGKSPPMNRWQDIATTDEKLIRQWWTGKYAACGLGIATEARKFVLDVDNAEDSKTGKRKVGDATLASLEFDNEPLPTTVEAATGGGGRHLWFTAPEGYEIRNNQHTLLGDDLDIRGAGGLVVAPPTIHPVTGQLYRWKFDPEEREIAEAPEWLLELLRPPERPVSRISNPPLEREGLPLAPVGLDPPSGVLVPDPFSEAKGSERRGQVQSQSGARSPFDGSPADRYDARTTWEEVLGNDGWTIHHRSGSGEQYWTRPGKDRRQGASATVGYNGRDLLVVFTSAIAGLPEGHYSRFDYLAATKHNGDSRAAARAVLRAEPKADRQERVSPADSPGEFDPWAEEEAEPEEEKESPFINWGDFWGQDHSNEEWLVDPILPKGKGVALFAPGGTGKSLFALWMCAMIATGQACLNTPAGECREVVYVDYEMTESDLMERLEQMGFSPESDMSHLHYVLMPTFDPLDTEAGGAELVRIAKSVNADIVVIDTFSRAVQGEENEAQTVLDYYRVTASRLKRAHIGMLRVGHSGKDMDKGERGTSAKRDDVDIVWRMLEREPNRFELKAIKKRVAWVPTDVVVHRNPIEDQDILLFKLPPHATSGWPAGTAECAALLDALGAVQGVSSRAASDLLKAAGEGRRRAVVTAAVKYRKMGGKEAFDDPFGGGTGYHEKTSDDMTSGSGTISSDGSSGTGVGTGGTDGVGTPSDRPREGGNHPGNHPEPLDPGALGIGGGFLEGNPPVPTLDPDSLF